MDMTPEPSAPTPRSRSQRRHDAARDALRAFIRDAAEHEFSLHQLGKAEIELSLSARVEPGNQWAIRFEPDLHEQIREQLGDVFAERGVYQHGRIHCFRCRSSACEHADAPDTTQVFKQYAATGEPVWHELPQAFIQARDERVDRLYATPPQLAALVCSGRELKTDQLTSFGRSSKSYAILGQVVCGYFHDPAGSGRFAITFQFVETRTATGQLALRLNPVCHLPKGGDLAERYASGWGAWVQRAHRKAESVLEEMARRINEAGEDRHKVARSTLKRIPGVMQRFAQSLDRGHRQTRRRTHHAEERRQQDRPVHMAFKDAIRAKDETVLYEERSDAVVVPGPQGRIHLFSRGGKHMTSFVGKPGTVDQRRRSQRWIPLAADKVEAFRDALAERRPGEKEMTNDDVPNDE